MFEKSSSFIAWICPLFKPQVVVDFQYIYFEGDEVAHVYFLQEGSCGYVLPKHNNFKYISLNKGNHFGFIDILGSVFKNEDISLEEWFFRKDKMKRHFTLMSDSLAEMLVLSIQDIHRIQVEFQEVFEELMTEERGVLQQILTIKFKTIRKLQKNQECCGHNKKEIQCYDLYQIYEMADQTQKSEQEISEISSVDSFDLQKREYEETEKKVTDGIGLGVKNLMSTKKTELTNKKQSAKNVVNLNESFHSSYTLSSCDKKDDTECKKKGAHHRNINKSKTIVEYTDQAQDDNEVLKETKEIMNSMKKRF